MQMEQRGRGFTGLITAYRYYCTIFCAVIALSSGGCSSSSGSRGFVRVITPLPPPFLTGPSSVLLTNWGGFSAHVEIQAPGALNSGKPASGQLLSRGSRLFYAPESDESTGNRRKTGGFAFIWDVAQSKGYVLSDALQGYAPVAAELHVTNVTVQPGANSAQRYSGHPSEPATAIVSTTDGVAGFELLRAIDLNAFPIRIESATNSSVFTLSISKVRFEQPAADVFSPPDGFTRYTSAEVMADELAARQSNLRRKGPGLTPSQLELQQQQTPSMAQPPMY